MRERIRPHLDELTAWRRDFHRHPETAFAETRTSSLVAERLAAMGLEVHRGLGGTGVAGTLRRGSSSRSLLLRSEMDALPIREAGSLPHRSVHEGRMHACGHDGHMAMLLGAARLLAGDPDLDGTVHFLFQPGEEGAGGAPSVLRDGLFSLCPAQAVFGLHTWPDLPAGSLATRPGPFLAGSDTFEILFRGRGAHAALPRTGANPLPAAARTLCSLQGLVSRSLGPEAPAVVTVTQIQGGETWNAIPETALLRGTARSLEARIQGLLESSIEAVVREEASASGVNATLTYRRGYPPTVNTAPETALAVAAAAEALGPDRGDGDHPPVMVAEDFSFYLRERPGCFVLLGGGGGGSPGLHSPEYDFDDDTLEDGVAWWVSLTRGFLGR